MWRSAPGRPFELARTPEVARELDRARDDLERLAPAARYQALVGLTLARLADLALQRRLIAQRQMLAASGSYPDL